MFTYSKEIEEVKVVHAVSLLAIAGFICYMVAKKRLLSRGQYNKVLCATCIVTILYFMPVVMIAKKTYDLRGPDAERGAKIFADWIYILMKNNDTNVVGLGLSCAIHGQIYVILFGMQWVTYGLRNLIRKLESLRDSGRSDYDSVALTSILTLAEDRPKGMLDSGISHAVELKKQGATTPAKETPVTDV